MGDDDYEILPSRDIENLKNQLEAFRSGPTGAARSSMDNLNDSINRLLNLFKEASESLKIQEDEQDLLEKEIAPMGDKVDKLLDQNRKIAEGIVALADMINEVKDAMETLNDKVEAMSKENKQMPSLRPMQQQGFDNQMMQPMQQPMQSPFGPGFGEMNEEPPMPPLGGFQEAPMGRRPGPGLPPLPPLR